MQLGKVENCLEICSGFSREMNASLGFSLFFLSVREVYKIDVATGCWKIPSLTSRRDFLSLLSRHEDTFQVNIPTTNPGWKTLCVPQQQQSFIIASKHRTGICFGKKKENFRCRTEFEFIFHQTRIEFQFRPRGFFLPEKESFYACVKSEKRVIQFRIEATMPSNLLLL
jgi:hypothetical protein